MRRLEGRVALVTGANRGIGEAAARALAGKGATVVVGSRELHAGEAVAHEIGGETFAVRLDVGDPASCRSAIDEVIRRCGSLHVLVNNAAVALDQDHRTEELPVERLDESFRINLRGPFLLIQAALPHMRAAGWGRIVNVSTGLSRLSEGMSGGWPSYRITKVALNALTRNLASELRGSGVLVNAIDPGWVKTRMGGAGAPRAPEEAGEEIAEACCLPDDGPSGELLLHGRSSAF